MSKHDKFCDEMRFATSDEEREAIRKKYAPTPVTLGSLFKEWTIGLTFAAFCGLLLCAVYVGGFGYGLGTFFYYAFVTVAQMPFDFHTMYQCALIPGLNIFMLVIAIWIVAVKFAIIAVIWMYTNVFSWVPAWFSKVTGR